MFPVSGRRGSIAGDWTPRFRSTSCFSHFPRQAQDFGPRFISLARAVYQNNDQRAALKREINLLLGSKIVEEKSYQPY